MYAPLITTLLGPQLASARLAQQDWEGLREMIQLQAKPNASGAPQTITWITQRPRYAPRVLRQPPTKLLVILQHKQHRELSIASHDAKPTSTQ